jgi:hypothetical protein
MPKYLEGACAPLASFGVKVEVEEEAETGKA